MAQEDAETAVPEAKAAEAATTVVETATAEITAEEMVVDATEEAVTQQAPHSTSTTSTQIRHHSKMEPP